MHTFLIRVPTYLSTSLSTYVSVCYPRNIIIIIIIIITFLLTYLPTAIEFSLGGSSPYSSTDKTNSIHKRNNTKTVQTIQNTVNTSAHITKTPTHDKTNTYTHPHFTKQDKTTTAQNTNHMK